MVAYDFLNIISKRFILSVEVRVDQVHRCVSDRPSLMTLLARLRIHTLQQVNLLTVTEVGCEESFHVALLQRYEVSCFAFEATVTASIRLSHVQRF